jgi:hypothetical protein
VLSETGNMDTRVYLHSRIFISVYGIEENVIKAESQEMKKGGDFYSKKSQNYYYIWVVIAK